MSVCPPQARLWVQLMRELRHGVKLKKVQEKQFNPLPTEYQLTPFEMLMQDIRARNYKLRKVMVSAPCQPLTLHPATLQPSADPLPSPGGWRHPPSGEERRPRAHTRLHPLPAPLEAGECQHRATSLA